jgi:hypothetical protein
MRKTRSYASLGGRRLRASRTTSDSSGIRSSALEVVSTCLKIVGKTPRAQLTTLLYAYLKPSDLYPAALLYQLAIGVNQVLSHGRLMTKLTREGCDMVVRCAWRCRLSCVVSSMRLTASLSTPSSSLQRESAGMGLGNAGKGETQMRVLCQNYPMLIEHNFIKIQRSHMTIEELHFNCLSCAFLPIIPSQITSLQA